MTTSFVRGSRDKILSPAEILGRELAVRKAMNGNYTLRSFARDAGIYPSKMSEILNGKRGLSAGRALSIARRLHWDSSTTGMFCESATHKFSRSPAKRREAKKKIQRFLDDPKRILDETEFRVIADWYHLAALSLAEINGRSVNQELLVQKLGISKEEARLALGRLALLKLIEPNGGGFRLASDSTRVPSVKSSQAIKTFHGQILEKARAAIHTQPTESRENAAAILTLSHANLPRAKKLVQEFQEKFFELMMEDAKSSDSVYCFSMQLFELASLGRRGCS